MDRMYCKIPYYGERERRYVSIAKGLLDEHQCHTNLNFMKIPKTATKTQHESRINHPNCNFLTYYDLIRGVIRMVIAAFCSFSAWR